MTKPSSGNHDQSGKQLAGIDRRPPNIRLCCIDCWLKESQPRPAFCSPFSRYSPLGVVSEQEVDVRLAGVVLLLNGQLYRRLASGSTSMPMVDTLRRALGR